MSNYIFNATCELTDLTQCQPGTHFMDPCNCTRYYQCTNTYSMSTSTCNQGTLYDYTLSICNHDIDVDVSQNCSSTNAWTRCNTTGVRLEELKVLCTGSPTNTPNITAQPPVSEPSSDSNISAGMVAGLIIAGAVITLAIIALYVLYSRRKKANEQKIKRRTTIENREYFENGQLDDPYAIIDDRMVSPTYNQNNNNVISGTANGTLSTTTTTLPGDETLTEYDNSAFREEDYTATLERSPVSPYDTLSTSTKSYEKPRNSTNHDVIGASSGDAIVAGSSDVNTLGESFDSASGDAAGGVSNEVGVNADGNKDENTDRRVNDDMDAPDYYKLEQDP